MIKCIQKKCKPIQIDNYYIVAVKNTFKFDKNVI